MSSTSTAAASNTQTILNISSSGTNGTSAQTTYGAQIANSHAGTTSTNVALQLAATNGATANYALLTNGGNVGIGDTSPAALLTVGSGDLFQVNSSGAIAAVVGITSSSNYVQSAGTFSVTSANTTQVTTSSAMRLAANSLTTGTGFYAASSTLTSGLLMDLQVSGTAAAASQTALNILTTGANATSTITSYGAQFSNTHSGTASTNVAAYFSASGGTNNYAAVFANGNVGIRSTTPNAPLSIGVGDGVGTFTNAQISLGFNSTSQYAHFIHTRHDGSGTGGAIDFYLNDGTAGGVFPTNAVIGMSIKRGTGLGIGITDAINKLDVEGAAVIGATYSYGWFWRLVPS